MNKTFKNACPFLLILLGLLLLLFGGQAAVAGGCILIGIVMLVERVWPEKW